MEGAELQHLELLGPAERLKDTQLELGRHKKVASGRLTVSNYGTW